MFRLSALYRYPIKSSAAESLERVALDALGVVGDRRWMAVDTKPDVSSPSACCRSWGVSRRAGRRRRSCG